MFCYILSCFFIQYALGHPKDVAWAGGPLHFECEHRAHLFTNNGQYIKENIIATKAVTFADEIYLLTPRFKRGVPSSVCQLEREQSGIELQAYPDLGTHTLADCDSIQNAVDFHLDYLGNLWVLDSGIVDTLESPRCTCPPKVVTINLLLGKLTKQIDISSVTEPTSTLQNIIVEYALSGKVFIYVTDASHGAILVYDVTSNAGWVVLVCSPVMGLQSALMKRGPTHSILLLIKVHHEGMLEVDTAALRRKKTKAPIRMYGDHTKPVILLGWDIHHVYLRHAECADVLSWNTRDVYNASNLINIHSPGPNLTPTSVASDPLKHVILVLGSNYADTVSTNSSTYHRITYIGQH